MLHKFFCACTFQWTSVRELVGKSADQISGRHSGLAGMVFGGISTVCNPLGMYQETPNAGLTQWSSSHDPVTSCVSYCHHTGGKGKRATGFSSQISSASSTLAISLAMCIKSLFDAFITSGGFRERWWPSMVPILGQHPNHSSTSTVSWWKLAFSITFLRGKSS